jgi:hypothetical protein
MMIEKKYYTKNPMIFTEKIDEVGIILFDEERKETHLLNQSAMLIWELIEDKMTVCDVFSLYCKSIDFNDISPDKVEKDFCEIITLLEEKNTIREMKDE